MSSSSTARVEAILGALLSDEGAIEVRGVVDDESAQLLISRRARRESVVVDDPGDGAAFETADFQLGDFSVTTIGTRFFARRVEADEPHGLRALVEEGALMPGLDEAIVGSALAGQGLWAIGPARLLRRRLVRALLRDLEEVAHVIDLDKLDGELSARVRVAKRLGAEIVVAHGGARELARAAERSGLVWIADVDEGAPARAFEIAGSAAQIVVVGYTADGVARVLERHAPGATPPVATPAPATAPQLSAPVLEPAAEDLPPLPPLADAPPDDWGGTQVENDPGWELGGSDDGPASASAFDKVLERVKDEDRPQFVPRPPSEHPLARKLKKDTDDDEDDPLGGLDLEPPALAGGRKKRS